MIYTDGVHLVADSEAELHRFAVLLGLKLEWFQSDCRWHHYDLTTTRMAKRAVEMGAVQVSKRVVLAKAKEAGFYHAWT